MKTFEAVPPFRVAGKTEAYVRDAKQALVLVCDVNDDPCAFYSENAVLRDAHFTCPKCGRLGQRMDYATPKQCGL